MFYRTIRVYPSQEKEGFYNQATDRGSDDSGSTRRVKEEWDKKENNMGRGGKLEQMSVLCSGLPTRRPEDPDLHETTAYQ